MAAVSPSEERINFSGNTSCSELATDIAPEASSPADIPCTADSPDLNDEANSSPNPSRDGEDQQLAALRSEEYRQLFRLPVEEVLVQDFNCAFQESILLQGHMYLFVRYICFYSNIFGFETKKVIPFHEITSVKRAKTAGIFPNAIEIFAGGKKYFFASFLSRDEAFKIINDGWLQHGNGSLANSDQQESISVTSIPENANIVIEEVNSSNLPVNDLNSSKRDGHLSNDPEASLNVENDEPRTLIEVENANFEEDVETVRNTDSSCSSNNWSWKMENADAPKVPECFTKVAETKFPMKVEEFFRLFFSDAAVNFMDSFHRRCGDKEFRCTSWRPHDEFGHARDVSFQHPIKIYLGAKFGSCQEVQKFRVYKNSHLVIETSQEITDVPYGDYFRVEGLWDVGRDDDGVKEGCILQVYVNVAFVKRTVWKGKIVQSTVEECKEAYALWMSMAHDLLKQKNEKQEEGVVPACTIRNDNVPVEMEVNSGEPSNRPQDTVGKIRRLGKLGSKDTDQQVASLLQESLNSTTSIASLLREFATKFCSFVKSQSRVSLVLVISFVVIFLMQVTILVLLNRPQHIHVASPPDYMGGGMGIGLGGRSEESVAWLEKRMHYLKDEMLMVEARLERMRHEHAVLKAQLKDLENLHKRQ